MRSCIIELSWICCRIISIMFPYRAAEYIKKLVNKLYTFWLSSEFRSIGKTSSINRPIRIKGGKYVSIGKNAGIGQRAVLTAWDLYKGYSYNPEIVIGDRTWIGDDVHISAINKILIGNDVLIGKKVTITDNAHGSSNIAAMSIPPTDRPLISKGPVLICDRVWIGDKVTILSGVQIGINVVIGANSVVTKDLPANSIAAGVPAKIIHKL